MKSAHFFANVFSRNVPIDIRVHPYLTRIAVGSREVSDEFLVTCPFCGEQLEIYVEPDVTGSFIQDCEVCCNPWRVGVSGRGEDRAVDVTRADGSE